MRNLNTAVELAQTMGIFRLNDITNEVKKRGVRTRSKKTIRRRVYEILEKKRDKNKWFYSRL